MGTYVDKRTGETVTADEDVVTTDEVVTTTNENETGAEAVGAGVGALAGAGIGMAVGGPPGAAIGGLVGAVGGAIAGESSEGDDEAGAGQAQAAEPLPGR
ncbi:MAG: glycine zipper domain-containing protein [Chloroflexota bacterium]